MSFIKKYFNEKNDRVYLDDINKSEVGVFYELVTNQIGCLFGDSKILYYGFCPTHIYEMKKRNNHKNTIEELMEIIKLGKFNFFLGKDLNCVTLSKTNDEFHLLYFDTYDKYGSSYGKFKSDKKLDEILYDMETMFIPNLLDKNYFEKCYSFDINNFKEMRSWTWT